MLCAVGQWVSALAILGMGFWWGVLDDLDFRLSEATLYKVCGILARYLPDQVLCFCIELYFRAKTKTKFETPLFTFSRKPIDRGLAKPTTRGNFSHCISLLEIL